MQNIWRHPLDKKLIRDWKLIRMERLNKLKNKYEWDLVTLELFARTSFEVAIYSIVLENTVDALYHFKEALKGYTAFLKLLSFDKEVLLLLDGDIEYKFFPVFPQKGVKASVWLRVYYLALILRNEEVKSFLFTIPVTKIIYPQTEETSVLLKNYLQFFYSFCETIPDYKKLEDCRRITDRNKALFSCKITPENIPYLSLSMMYHEICVLETLFLKGVGAFNLALEKVLLNHRSFWSQKKVLRAGGDPVNYDFNGFISLPLTAICTIAYDKDLQLDLESDYIPDFLITGEEW